MRFALVATVECPDGSVLICCDPMETAGTTESGKLYVGVPARLVNGILSGGFKLDTGLGELVNARACVMFFGSQEVAAGSRPSSVVLEVTPGFAIPKMQPLSILYLTEELLSQCSVRVAPITKGDCNAEI